MQEGKFSFLSRANSDFIEDLYQKYLKNPSQVDSRWREFFSQISSDLETNLGDEKNLNNKNLIVDDLQAQNIINQYQVYGHYFSNLDPLSIEKPCSRKDFAFQNEIIQDYIKERKNINLREPFLGFLNYKSDELINILEKIYCSSIGYEIGHIDNLEQRNWLFKTIEAKSSFSLDENEKKQILQELIATEGFEEYLHLKFPAAKRFSVQGAEGFIIALSKMLELEREKGVSSAVLGMAHRGRISSVAQILGKSYAAIFAEFAGVDYFPQNLNISGDVKYHLGYHGVFNRAEKGNKIQVTLLSNPSHLESINAVLAGYLRAKQETEGQENTIGILVHGDAAFCGQGVVAEALYMSSLEAYNTKGIIHFIINNQIGFTANTKDTRQGRYPTDFAKIINAPIFHVNGEDIESLIKAVEIASLYRQQFQKDVVIDIFCYRKYGHNEGDEPAFTQAPMYKIIRQKKSLLNLFIDELIKDNIVQKEFIQQKISEFKNLMEKEFSYIENYKNAGSIMDFLNKDFTKNITNIITQNIDKETKYTGVAQNILIDLALNLFNEPFGFDISPKIARLLKQRVENFSLADQIYIDWAVAEQLAFASLLKEGVSIRLVGQDSGRGTFSHRHSIFHSQSSNEIYQPLNNIKGAKGKYFVANSNLSEYGALAFEYGYSVASISSIDNMQNINIIENISDRKLVIWEAQFGDFANGAQIIFDQYIAAGQAKWLNFSNLVVFLPHGFEGQGPEHSSARLERFLQLAAENNMIIANPTTPASFFHLLRRQIYGAIKPLVIMTPKSLLRHKFAVSNLADFDESTSFREVLDDENYILVSNQDEKLSKVKKIIFCTGKFYYDLLEERKILGLSDIAIIRLEQIYPFAEKEIEKILKKYHKAENYLWCQEEPKNMGAWSFVFFHLQKIMQKEGINKNLEYIGRKKSSSVACGSQYRHNKEQKNLVLCSLKN